MPNRQLGRTLGLRQFPFLAESKPVLYTTGPQVLAANGSAAPAVRTDSRLACLITSVRKRESTTSRTSLQVTDQRIGHEWMGRAAQLDLVAGSGQQPYVLPVPVLAVPEGGATPVFTVRLADISGAGVTVEVTFEGVTFPVSRLTEELIYQLSRKRPFFHSASLVIAAGAGTGTGFAQYQLQDDADFEMHDLQAGALTAWDLKLSTIGDRYSYMNLPVRVEEVAGNGVLPGTFARPLRFRKGDTARIDAVNQQAGGQTIETVLAGCKVFA